MKKITVGTYEAGWEQIELVLCEGYSGRFYFIPKEKNKPPRIEVGADHDKFIDVLDVLIHEIDEYVMSKMGLRYRPTETVTNSHDNYIFHMTHMQFTDKTSRISEFIYHSTKPLHQAWKKWKKTKNAKKKTAPHTP